MDFTSDKKEAGLRKRILATASLLLVLGWSFAKTAPAQEISPEAQQVVDYLVSDWKKQFRSTSIALAMENLGMKPDDGIRLDVGDHFRNNTNLARNLQFWGANNYILSNDEKRTAKYLMDVRKNEDRTPGLAEASSALAIPAEELRPRLNFMADAGFLTRDSTQELGYSLADGFERWGGPLRHNFHTLHVEGERPFDVW